MKRRDDVSQIIVCGKEVSDRHIQHLAKLSERTGIRRVLALLILIDARRCHGRIEARSYAKLALRQPNDRPRLA